jgi:hypothetical protein
MDAYKTIEVKGFDSFGEPEIKVYDDGHIEVMFNFMPAHNTAGEPSRDRVFDIFDKWLEFKLGVNVVWEDRELFIISKPAADTAQKLKTCLEDFWQLESA